MERTLSSQQRHSARQTKPSCNVLIVGAGLAGLATAIAIRRTGHQVTVLERMPELHEVKH